jgi:hypothetical protein
MIRSLRVADVATLLLFLGKSPINVARVRDRLSDKGWELGSAVPLLKGCLVSGDKQCSLVYVRHVLIQGLVCLRSCRGPNAWEIERLLLAAGHEECCLDLLERLGSAAEEVGAGRLFLRIESNSHTVDMARQAGFSQHLTEYLYRLGEEPRVEPPEPPVVLRPKLSADEYGLFRLYSATVPLRVRSVEGMTFEEWHQSRDRVAVRELVFENGGEITVLLRIRPEGMAGQFDIVTDLGSTELGRLVDYCLSVLRGRNSIYCLVPEFQQQLRSILEERGFRQVAEYGCLSKQLEVRVREPQLVPLSA